MELKSNVWFLVYPQRSGSTFLAAQLEKHSSEILVIPETRIIEYLFSEDSSHIFSRYEIEQMIKYDHQIANLDLSEVESASFIDNSVNSNALSILANLIDILKEKAKKKEKIVIIKLGTQIYNIDNLRAHIGDVHLLFIYRDPRGVVNSLLSNERPNFPGEKMGRGDIWFATKRWKRFMNAMARAKEQAWVSSIVVRYEELVRNTRSCIGGVIEELGIREEGLADERFAYNVREKEKEIHKLANSPSQRERIYGWQTELKKYQGMAVEWIAREEMENYSYDIYFSIRGGLISKCSSLTQCFIQHVYISMINYLRRFVYYSLRPGLAVLRVKVWRERR